MDHFLFQDREAQKELLASNDDLSDNNITKVSDLKQKKLCRELLLTFLLFLGEKLFGQDV